MMFLGNFLKKTQTKQTTEVLKAKIQPFRKQGSTVSKVILILELLDFWCSGIFLNSCFLKWPKDSTKSGSDEGK